MKDFIDFFSEQNKTNKPTIYCDMDGVLVDIVGGISKILGVKITQQNFDSVVDPKKAWFDKNHPNLFATLPWASDGKQLWAYISKHKVEILSARTTTWQPASKSDKMEWIKKHMRPQPHFSNIVYRDQKKDHAVTNGVANILIDDWNKNIKEWVSLGGIGIKHKNTVETIAALKKLGF